jgi:glycosyltransferase involved in cell wall biosynthesis
MAQPTSFLPVPRVAVIVPAYGVAHLLEEALASVQAQTLTDWECVVIDDGAPDDVAAAVAPFLTDQRIRFLATDNRGVSSARNRAIESCTAPLIALLDGDDMLRPDYLDTMTAAMVADPAVRIATCNARVFGAVPQERLCFSGPQPEGTLAHVLDRSFGIYIGSTFRRADWASVGGFDRSLSQCEDFDFWLRLLQLGGRAIHVDSVLGDYRVRAGSASDNEELMLIGNLRAYQKVQAALPAEATELPLIARLIAATQRALAFEHAIDRIVDGDIRRGVAELTALRGQVSGLVWDLSFAVWRLAPALARPMLRLRRKRNSRDRANAGFSDLFQKAAV